MSYIAVNVQEVRKEVIRIDLEQALHGKDGKTQTGKFINLDTGKEMKGVVFKRRGFYEIKLYACGEKIFNVKELEEDFSFQVKRLRDKTIKDTEDASL